MVADLRDAPGVQKALDLFYFKNRGALASSSELESVTNFGASFGLQGLWAAGLNLTRQFIGSYTVNVFPTGDRTLTIVVSNVTSMKSAGYRILPSWERSWWGPFGNLTQFYWWTQEIDSARLSWAPDPQGWKPGDVQWQYYHFKIP